MFDRAVAPMFFQAVISSMPMVFLATGEVAGACAAAGACACAGAAACSIVATEPAIDKAVTSAAAKYSLRRIDFI